MFAWTGAAQAQVEEQFQVIEKKCIVGPVDLTEKEARATDRHTGAPIPHAGATIQQTGAIAPRTGILKELNKYPDDENVVKN